ncbi:Fic family protein [Neisseria perflava]|uniref:Fic family protein n=1 Tax=Neisseria perflava TaxID=33053 RepID=UPI00209E458B|nr:Fic family protein [Neisseria perflava]MCP1773223.1 Fic family protein [Neisseria perflava]
MRKVEKPLPIHVLMGKHAEHLNEVLNADLSDISNDYIHWDKLRRCSRNMELNEKRWLKIKLARVSTLRTTPLLDKNGQLFQFNLPNHCFALIHKIDELRARLTQFYMAKRHKSEFLSNALKYEESISSSQLEGAATTRVVALQMLEEERKPQTVDEKMIMNNYLLMKEVSEQKNVPLSIELILQLHHVATNGLDDNIIKPGILRDNNEVYVVNYQRDPVHVPPDYADLEKRLQVLCDFANTLHEDKSFIHPIIKAIILHFMIGYEHPFFDGNGRTARALFYWYMMKNGYSEFEYISISKLLKNAASKYAASYLYTETDDNDLTYFIIYQLEIIKRSIEELFKFLDKKNQEFNEILNWLSETSIANELNAKEIILLKRAIKNPGKVFSAREVKNTLGVGDNTARKYLENLCKHKLLIKSSLGRTTIYISRQDIVNLLNQRKL